MKLHFYTFNSKGFALISSPCNFRHGICFLRPPFFLLVSLILFQAFPLHAAQSTSNSSSGDQYDLYQGHVYPSIAIVLLVLFMAIFTTGCLAIYIGGCADAAAISFRGGQRQLLPVSVPSGSRKCGVRGLDGSEIAALSTFIYSDVKELKIGKGSLECAVCLSEFQDDETLRLLPRCDHVFHPACIDPWLTARSTCPVCRVDLLAPKVTCDFAAASACERRESTRSSTDATDGGGSASSFEDEGEFRDCECDKCLQRVGFELTASKSAAARTEKPERTVKGGGGIWKFSRSNSTGHPVVILAATGVVEENYVYRDRFRLTLPEEVRRQVMVMSVQMKRTKSFAALPRVPSPRRGYRSDAGGEDSNSRSIRLLSLSQLWTPVKKGGGDQAEVGGDGEATAAAAAAETEV